MARATGPGHDRVDLLTVLAHEFGHALGLDDLTQQNGLDGILNATLPPGVRRSPTAADLTAAAIDAALVDDIELEDALVAPLAKQLRDRQKGA